jgi:hypothetical protein
MESPIRYAPGIRLTRSAILKQASMLMKNSGMGRKEAMKHAWAVGRGGPGYMWMPWTIAVDPAIIVDSAQFTTKIKK